MVHIGELSIGFFYTKDKHTLSEINGGEVVKAPSEYAKTASGNVVALVSKNGEVLDIDDIPCDDVSTSCDESFVAFVRSGSTSAFLVSPSLLSMFSDITTGNQGELLSIEVESESFTLKVLKVDNIVSAEDIDGGGKYLLLVADGNLQEDAWNKIVTVSSASATIFDIS